MNLLFFGDSIVQGMWDENGGWPSRIKQEIYKRHLESAEPYNHYNMVYMRGVSSNTSEDLKKRIDEELKDATEHSSSEVTVVFSIGINDCGISNRENKVSKEDYRENLRDIIDKSENYAEQVIAVGLNPIDERRLLEEKSADKYTNSEVREYNDILREVCSEKGAKFISIFEELTEDKDWNRKLFDGLHPNSEGHKKIYEIVKKEIISELDLQNNR